MSNEASWYYVVDGSRQGPVTPSDLRRLAADGRLRPDSQVWRKGMASWVPAHRISGLFGGSKPPPLPAGKIAAPAADGPPPIPSGAGDLPPSPSGLRKSGAIGVLAAVAPAVAGALLWIPYGAIMGPQNGSMTRTIIVYSTVIVVAVLIGIEAHRLGMGGPNDSRKTKPVSWAALTGLFFVIGFPVYMYVRSRYGERNLILVAIVSMIAFLGSSIMAAS